MIFSAPFITRDMPYDGVDVWEVVEAFLCWAENGETYLVPQGFVTDCASIPSLVWPAIGLHPRSPEIAQSAAMHDLFYRYQPNGISRSRSDDLIVEGMVALGASWWQRFAVRQGLRVGGWVAWNRYRKLNLQMPPVMSCVPAC